MMINLSFRAIHNVIVVACIRTSEEITSFLNNLEECRYYCYTVILRTLVFSSRLLDERYFIKVIADNGGLGRINFTVLVHFQ